jgi:hypothetical protein
LEGLNTQGRQWTETITILDDGSLQGLEGEVEPFRHLEHHRVEGRTKANIVVAFIDRLSHNRATEKTLRVAESQGIPAFIVSRYNAQNFPEEGV